LNKDIKKQVAEVLKNQQNVFGDDLYEKITFSEIKYESPKLKVSVVAETSNISLDKNLFNEEFVNSNNLDELYNQIHTCQKCDLGLTRTKFVFGVGNPNADLLLIGEAPGAEEDKQGIPFVGRAGKLLTDILKAINFEREDVYIANILKCRPPNNRDPLPSEREICKPYLFKQIELIKPKIILCLGRIASNVLLNKNESLTKLRSQVFEIDNIKIMATYHPAALLRNPNWKKGCWEDVQKVRKLYDELV